MTLQELSCSYRYAASLLRKRLKLLRRQEKLETEKEAQFQLHRRILMLSEMLTQMNELAELTQHYYERGYKRNEKYTL